MSDVFYFQSVKADTIWNLPPC